MNKWLLLTFVLLFLFGMSVIKVAFSSYEDWVPLTVPEGVEDQSFGYRCPAVFSGNGVGQPIDPGKQPPYPPAREACSPFNGQKKTLYAVDLGLAFVMLTGLSSKRVRHALNIGAPPEPKAAEIPA